MAAPGRGGMRLDLATWQEVETYLRTSSGIIIPTGSTEQHGPMGLIGTDAICAEEIAEGAAALADAIVAPTLAYTPAPFNMAFPGTMSVSEPLFEAMVSELLEGLLSQGFGHIYFLNGHGANLAPLKRAADRSASARIRIRSWWEIDAVDALRKTYYGDWEGMHATPSEVAITQATHRIVPPGPAETPPRKISQDFIERHAGDRHGPAKQHRQQFPDGRVGSHSALATPQHGGALLKAAQTAVAEDYLDLLAGGPPQG
jgi:creatinine amidohydrolase